MLKQDLVSSEDEDDDTSDKLGVDEPSGSSNSLPRSASSTLSSLNEVLSSGSSHSLNEQNSTSSDKLKLALDGIINKNIFPWRSRESPSSSSKFVSGRLIQNKRPSHLPAKTSFEEEKHRKAYDEILEAARKKELREERERELKREQQLREETRLAEDSWVWNRQILPKFEALRNTKKTRDLWWKGLPPNIRGKVWRKAIKNQLNITSHLYQICLDRAFTLDPLNESLMAIKLDVSRTFPSLRIFQNGGPLYECLHDILSAYSVYRPDVGYVQGMSFIGAILSLNMEPHEAFICFANLLNQPCHRTAFTLNQSLMNNYYKVYLSTLAHRLPKIYSHFNNAGLSPDLYLLDWLYTIYAKAMPLDVACRVWDVFLRDGEEFLFRTALGVLSLYQVELLQMDFIHGAQFLTKLPEDLKVDALFESISHMSTTIGSTNFQQMLQQLSDL